MSYSIRAVVDTKKHGVGGTLNLRKDPNGSTLVKIPDNSTVYVTSLDGEWLATRYTNTSGRTYTGYVMAKFIKGSSVYNGQGSGVNPGGISGNGHNSTVMASHIRLGQKIWKEDTSTTHYQIHQLQQKLNLAKEGLTDLPADLKPDGIYGPKTTEMVRAVQGIPWNDLDVDGLVGRYTLSVIESKFGRIAD